MHGIAHVQNVGDARLGDWPVVYVLQGGKRIYVGESINVRNRFTQHLASPNKEGLDTAYVVLDDSFNKSAALDLESHLVRWISADGKFDVLNRNQGILDAAYYDRAEYRARFPEVFEQLKSLGIFEHSIKEIEQSDLFKLSPYKALNQDQEQVIQSYLGDLIGHLKAGTPSMSVIQGDPGTGKTIVGVYLMKLLIDLARAPEDDETEDESILNDPFVAENRGLLEGLEIGLVIPTQSLYDSIRKVFAKVPGLHSDMVMTPFEIGSSDKDFNLLVVDESHRLNHRASQSSGPNNKKFAAINKTLFGGDDYKYTQVDWIKAKSDHQVFLLDVMQGVRTADLPLETLQSIASEAEAEKTLYPLTSQMRIQAGGDYIKYLREVLSDDPPWPRRFPNYDLRWFEDISEMEYALGEKEREVGLSRMVAGFAWAWNSKKKGRHHEFDIEIEGMKRRWNTTDKDWVRSPNAAEEVGCIHTVQGYDLNYAGVIFGKDLRYDAEAKRLFFDRSNYYDKRAIWNNNMLDITYSDEDLLRNIINIYVVLLTRGIRGTYVYVCDEPLRERLRPFFAAGGGS
jgi:DUF2075 family protein